MALIVDFLCLPEADYLPKSNLSVCHSSQSYASVAVRQIAENRENEP